MGGVAGDLSGRPSMVRAFEVLFVAEYPRVVSVANRVLADRPPGSGHREVDALSDTGRQDPAEDRLLGTVAEHPGPAIVTSDLTKTYGSVTALAGLSMSVPRAEVFGFLGPNGAGKTTAVRPG